MVYSLFYLSGYRLKYNMIMRFYVISVMQRLVNQIVFLSCLICTTGMSLKTTPLKSQSGIYIKVDSYALDVPASMTNDLTALSDYLVRPNYTAIEKIRSIYTWISYNIQYDQDGVKNGLYSYNFNATDVLHKRSAVCTGFSVLFKDLVSRQGIPVEVIEGYSRNVNQEGKHHDAPDHAWNAVYLDSSWQLIDLTWAAGLLQSHADKKNNANNRYFLSPPEIFILDHMPSMPMWQLLECPVPITAFGTVNYLARVDDSCFDHVDSINHYRSLPHMVQKVKQAEAAFSFNPTEKNKLELGHTYLDYASTLVDSSEQYVLDGDQNSLLILQEEVIEYCQKAKELVELHTWQREMYAHTLINYTITLFNTAEDIRLKPSYFFEVLQSNLEKAMEILESTESTYFVKSAIQQYEQFREILRDYIKDD